MDSRTGDLYESKEAALGAGVPEEDIVELRGNSKAIRRVSSRVRRLAKVKGPGRVRMTSKRHFRHVKARRKQQKASRRRNR